MIDPYQNKEHLFMADFQPLPVFTENLQEDEIAETQECEPPMLQLE